LYAYENDVLYSFSIPAFYKPAWRYYVNLHSNKLNWWKKGPQLQAWLRWGQNISSSAENNITNRAAHQLNSELKCQVVIGL
jgi:hypothetical protein